MFNPWYYFLTISICFFNLLPNGGFDYRIFFLYSTGKTSSLEHRENEKTEILTVCASALFCSILLSIVLIFSFYNKLFVDLWDCLTVELYHSLKIKIAFTIIFVKLLEIFKFNFRWMIQCCLLEFSFARYSHDIMLHCV